MDPKDAIRQQLEELTDYMLHAAEPSVDQLRSKINTLAETTQAAIETFSPRTEAKRMRDLWVKIAEECQTTATWCEGKSHIRSNDLLQFAERLSKLAMPLKRT
jgi:AAA+ superfamily predicted ATPase